MTQKNFWSTLFSREAFIYLWGLLQQEVLPGTSCKNPGQILSAHQTFSADWRSDRSHVNVLWEHYGYVLVPQLEQWAESWWSGSGQGLQVDSGQGEVLVDAETIDGPQVRDPMLVREQVFIVDGHLELTVGAQDLELQQQNQRPSLQLYSAMLVIPEVDKMKYLTWNGCPSTKGNLVSSLSSRPQILPMQLFLTITFLPFSLKRGLKWKARSRDVAKSTAILSDNTEKHGSTSDITTPQPHGAA